MKFIHTRAARVAAVLILPFVLTAPAGADGVSAPGAADTLFFDGAGAIIGGEGDPNAVAEADASTPAAFGGALTLERLDGMRGGDGNLSTTTNTADLDGRVNGNTASNVTGGGNLVSAGSFGNSAGISTVIQNSGSNVLIQNSTIVNVQFVSPTP